MFFRDANAQESCTTTFVGLATLYCRCLSKGVVSVNPIYFDIGINFIDEAIYFHTDLFSRDFPRERL